jgi:NhaB family Na+:H+ antiporter
MSQFVALFTAHFLGRAPGWYKATIVAFLLINPLVLWLAGPFVAGWLVVAEVIFTLAMAIKCYPLQPGGLVVLEAVLLGLASPGTVSDEIIANFAVLLLLMFMVAGIHFMKDLLLATFTRLLVGLRDKRSLALAFCATAAVLSAFLDALTVMAVVIAVGGGFWRVYLHVRAHGVPPPRDDGHTPHAPLPTPPDDADLEGFRAFLRDLLMHAAVGTALGGACTLVGEPQNLLIGSIMDWDFAEYARRMAPVAWPAFAAGLLVCWVVERQRWFDYGNELPASVRAILEDYAAREQAGRTPEHNYLLGAQAVVAACLVLGLLFHVAEVGLIGLAVIVLATAFMGVVEEHRLGGAFEEAMPFTALIVVFFGAVAVIHQQHLFQPVIEAVLAIEGEARYAAFFLANGLLSAISDNVFVATIYIRELETAFKAGALTLPEFERLAVAVNTGTNLPSVATPNGQAAFLFLLTSAVAPVLRLGYGTMVWKALPYTVVLTLVGVTATVLAG